MPVISLISPRAEVCPKSTRRAREKQCRVFKMFTPGFVLSVLRAAKQTVTLVFYLPACRVQEDTLLVLWQPVGEGMSSHTALRRMFLSLPGQNYHREIGAC